MIIAKLINFIPLSIVIVRGFEICNAIQLTIISIGRKVNIQS